ncbi:hypothetical protein QOT17_008016 [Balamuthia mandrillaris]
MIEGRTRSSSFGETSAPDLGGVGGRSPRQSLPHSTNLRVPPAAQARYSSPLARSYSAGLSLDEDPKGPPSDDSRQQRLNSPPQGHLQIPTIVHSSLPSSPSMPVPPPRHNSLLSVSSYNNSNNRNTASFTTSLSSSPPSQPSSSPQFNSRKFHPLQRSVSLAKKEEKKEKRKSIKEEKKKERKQTQANSNRKVRVRLRMGGKSKQPQPLSSTRTLNLEAGAGNWDLREEVIKIWRRPLEQLPVYKDLPRLVSRLTLEVRHRDLTDLPTEDSEKERKLKEIKREEDQSQQLQQKEKERTEEGNEPTEGTMASVPDTEVEGEEEHGDVEEIYFDQDTTWYVSATKLLPIERKDWTVASLWGDLNIKGLVSLVYDPHKARCKIYLYDQADERMLAERIDASHLLPTVDSSRYFVLQLKDESVPCGFAFFTREDSAAFLAAIEKYRTKATDHSLPEDFAHYLPHPSACFSPISTDVTNVDTMAIASTPTFRKPQASTASSLPSSPFSSSPSTSPSSSPSSSKPNPTTSKTTSSNNNVAPLFDDAAQKRLTFEALKRFSVSVAKELDPEEKMLDIERAFDDLDSVSHNLDSQLLMKDVVERARMQDTRTCQVFKTIHQNIIFTGAYLIKTNITKTLMTKDVRTKDGWTVHVLITPSAVIVTHTRKETSLETNVAKPVDKFWFTWELQLHFERDMSKLRAARLRITDLTFTPDTSEPNREKLMSIFCNGQLHVY